MRFRSRNYFGNQMYKAINAFLFDSLYGAVKYVPWGLGRFLRVCILKVWLKRLESYYILEGATFISPENISIGRNTTINEWVHLNGAGQIEIGDWVDIAHGVSIESCDHGYESMDEHMRHQKHTMGKITIEDYVWIGCGV